MENALDTEAQFMNLDTPSQFKVYGVHGVPVQGVQVYSCNMRVSVYRVHGVHGVQVYSCNMTVKML